MAEVSGVPHITPSDFGSWLLGLAAFVVFVGGCISIMVGIKKLMEPRPRNEQSVTQEQLAALQAQLALCATKSEIGHLEARMEQFATKAELGKVEAAVDRQQDYIRNRFHELQNLVAPMPAQLHTLSKQQDLMAAKTAHNSERIERVIALLEKPGTRINAAGSDRPNDPVVGG